MRLTTAQIKQYKKLLSTVNSPATMLNKVEQFIEEIGDVDFFTQPGLAFLRDAWIAAKFAKSRNASTIRLLALDSDWPDFEICVDDKLEKFEAVEALEDGRRRSKEYVDAEKLRLQGKPFATNDPISQWIKRANDIPRALEEACKKKIERNYPDAKQFGLVIYLNINEFGIRHQEVLEKFTHVTKECKSVFQSAWVLWKDVAHPVWQNGNQVNASPGETAKS